jgi:murein DD-endopeptidase MepM/ murein hydrolase activator NlpD
MKSSSKFQRNISHFILVLLSTFTYATSAQTAQAQNYSLPLPGDNVARTAGNLQQCHGGNCNASNYWAVDLMTPVGTPVYAISGGVVVRSQRDNSCGNMVRIADPNGFNWLYCHGSSRTVNKGDQVSAGQQIMWSGNTGRSGAPHLHVEVKLGNHNTQGWGNMYPVCIQPTLTDIRNGNTVNPRIVGTDPNRLGQGCVNP